MTDDLELTLVTVILDVTDLEGLLPALSKYVVLSRGHPGCRNIDFCTSSTKPGRVLLVQKWDDPASQRAHFDSAEMVEMAEACKGRLAHPPAIDLYEPISAHDLL